MLWIARALLAILFFVGALRLILFFRSGTPLFVERGQTLGPQRPLVLGFLNIVLA